MLTRVAFMSVRTTLATRLDRPVAPDWRLQLGPEPVFDLDPQRWEALRSDSMEGG